MTPHPSPSQTTQETSSWAHLSVCAFIALLRPQARVLYVNPTTKEVGLSLLPHLTNLTLPAAVPNMGQVRGGGLV